MIEEAKMKRGEQGMAPEGEGWFVVNVAEAPWLSSDRFGKVAWFEGGSSFPHFGINIRVLQPGQPACHYHRESQQEAFLVLQGECRLLVEGQERMLRQWDLFHCPPETNHVAVGAGDGPCVVLMVGDRDPEGRIVYPVDELALGYDAGVSTETTSPSEAYAGIAGRRSCPAPPPFA
jgi:uncharacterized cupin superfamily protein